MNDIACSMFSGDSLDEIYLELASLLFHYGEEVSPRDKTTIELVNVQFHLLNPMQSVITIPERKLSLKYLEAELDWYISGDRHIKNIKDHATIWSEIANDKGKINSNYGAFVFHDLMNSGDTQFEWCLKQLKKDPDSRQAVINYNDPSHKYDDNKDFVCTIAQQFLIRNGFLHCTTMARSNDFIYGLPYDIPWFTFVQEKLAKDLKLKLGIYTHFVTSLHVYKKHFKLLGEISNVYYRPN